jgi:primosomal protein N'
MVVQETWESLGAVTTMCKVGHAFIKKQMKETSSVIFASELSEHFYYHDLHDVESSDLSLLYILKLLSREQKPLSELLVPLKKYFHSGEINFTVAEKEKVIQLSGGMTPAKREKNYQQLLAVETPLVICTTPQFFIIPRHDIGSCIIDSSGSPYYVQDFSLPIDYRVIINRIAETLGINRYFSDSLLLRKRKKTSFTRRLARAQKSSQAFDNGYA